jgi:Tfp pilus assembly protein PilV
MVKQSPTGQSLIEIVFSIGVIILVLTAVISLVVSSLHSRTSGYDRKKAAELGQKVMEQLIQEKQQDPGGFWNTAGPFWTANLGATQVMNGYADYNYAIGFVQRTDASIGCLATPMVCADATVGVGYSSDVTQNVEFTRFFSR